MKLYKYFLSIGLVLALILIFGATPASAAPNNAVLSSTSAYYGYPYFAIKTVVPDKSVTILPYNFPANDKFVVRMGAYGTYGINGYVVDTVTTDADGNLSKTTFNIPATLAGSYRIAIRLESPNSGYYAYNWFYNNTTGISGASSYTGYPYFFISAVKRNTSVTIDPHHFPPNDKFVVRMGTYGTYGINGYVVDTVTTDADGNLSKTTFNIPATLAGSYRIAIRLESPNSGYYAYNWFYNNDAP